MQVEVTVPGTLPIEAAISQFNFLQGKVLTIIEASSEDHGKVKAMKDLVKSAFRDQMAWMETQGHSNISSGTFSIEPVNIPPAEVA